MGETVGEPPAKIVSGMRDMRVPGLEAAWERWLGNPKRGIRAPGTSEVSMWEAEVRPEGVGGRIAEGPPGLS